MIAPARLAAYDALYAIAGTSRDLPDALSQARARLTDDRDRDLAAELVIGTVRWQGKIDYILEALSGRRLQKLDPEVLQILRLGAHQLLHLDRIPPPAVVNDAVALTRRAGKTSAAGFVNAVLRKISRTQDPPLPPRPAAGGNALSRSERDAALDYLAVTLSHPRWLAARWLDRYGFANAERWASFDNAAAPLTLRINTLKTTAPEVAGLLQRAGVAVQPARYAPHGLVVTSGNPLRTPLAGTGLFFVQDEASQLVSLLAHARPGERILDACAAPGGKTTAMAAEAGDRASIVAADVRARRMRLLRQTIQVSGSNNIRLLQLDLERPLPFRDPFDVVLVDAPCSGLGTLRRDPDIRWKRQAADLEPLADAQLRMLTNASAVLRAGGRLIYSTCSSEPEENDGVVERFLAAHRAFTAIDLRQHDAETAGALKAVLDDTGRLRTLPHAHQLEAFFGVVLRREG
jgi:16S rRNA (cytosine967-C5)-methyltransferase